MSADRNKDEPIIRDFDLILYGGTGITGRQAAGYLTSNAPADLRWAAAGRDRAKLDALNLHVPLIVADGGDAKQLDALAVRTRVVLNMAGPFRLYGDALVAACLRQRTHYCDISGETARIRDLIDRHHADAEQADLRIVPFCGASSVPADVAAFLLAGLMSGGTLKATAVLRLGGGGFSTGTIASIGEAIDSGDASREADPFLLGPGAGRPPTPFEQDPQSIRRTRDLGLWLIPSPLGVSDTRAVRRSAALEGRDVMVQEYLACRSLAGAMATRAALASFRASIRLHSTRRLLSRLVGGDRPPKPEKAETASYDLRMVGTMHDGASAQVWIRCRGDAGNRVTVLCACESALALATEEAALPRRYGVLTPSVAMGAILPKRLKAAGMQIDVNIRSHPET